MSRIASLGLKNWLSFKGEHHIPLEDKVYGIFARQVQDQERSNWLGKSSLVEAVRFALNGHHRKRLEDEWVTRGEKFGEVAMALDNGARIVRSRDLKAKKGSLFFFPAGCRDKPLMKDEAQKAIDEMLGLSDEDFTAACYIQQGAMAKFITTRSEERMKTVSSWLRLAPLQRCEDNSDARIALISKKLEALTEYLSHKPDTEPPSPEQLEVARVKVDDAKNEVARLQNEVQKNAEAIAAKYRVQEFEQLAAEGKELSARLAATDAGALRSAKAEAEKRLDNATESASTTRRRLEQAKVLVDGNFDGTCPVAQIACPAKDQINSRLDANKKEHARAQHAHSVSLEEREKFRESYTLCSNQLGEVERAETKLSTLREQALKMLPQVEAAREAGEPHEPSVLRTQLEAAQTRLGEASDHYGKLKGIFAFHEEYVLTRTKKERELAELEKTVAPWRELSIVFKTAQRKIAENALGEIEEAANEVLTTCGIELQTKILWSRATKGKAKACDTCGNPFPASVKVKVCTRCGAERGMHMENKLEIELSDESGAANDLAGAAIQLGASAWLRRDRGSIWSTAILDEPFGQLDKAHRRRFGAHLASMLRGRYGFEQAMVIAHSPDVLDAFPGRIEIVSDGGYSRITVV